MNILLLDPMAPQLPDSDVRCLSMCDETALEGLPGFLRDTRSAGRPSRLLNVEMAADSVMQQLRGEEASGLDLDLCLVSEKCAKTLAKSLALPKPERAFAEGWYRQEQGLDLPWNVSLDSYREDLEMWGPRSNLRRARAHWSGLGDTIGKVGGQWLAHCEQHVLPLLFHRHSKLKPDRFRPFLAGLAQQQGTMRNLNELLERCGCSAPTLKEWYGIAADFGLVQEFSAIGGDPGSETRTRTTPRIGFPCSGLAHQLCNLHDLESLKQHRMGEGSWSWWMMWQLGHFLAALPGIRVRGHYQSSGGARLDLVVERKGTRIGFLYWNRPICDMRSLRGLTMAMRATRTVKALVFSRDWKPRLLSERVLSLPFCWL